METYKSTIHLIDSCGMTIVQDVTVQARSYGDACTLIETLYHPVQYSIPVTSNW